MNIRQSTSNHIDTTDTYSGSNSGKLLSHSIFSVTVSVAMPNSTASV